MCSPNLESSLYNEELACSAQGRGRAAQTGGRRSKDDTLTGVLPEKCPFAWQYANEWDFEDMEKSIKSNKNVKYALYVIDFKYYHNLYILV